jgi:phosphate-induced protein 1
MNFKLLCSVGCLLLGTATVYAQVAADLKPTGKGWGEPATNSTALSPEIQGSARARAGANGITYHGGPIITGGTTVYFIWYGSWNGNSATTILPHEMEHEGGTSYFNINTTYYNASGTHVTNKISYGGSTSDNYSQGKSLSDAKVKSVVSRAISNGSLPKNTHAVYFVLTSHDVNETSGFCSQYCGWHTSGSISGSDIKYAFVGNAARCISSCAAQSKGPNGNAGADGMASTIAHELEEATTDPDLNAWYDSSGEENADKCAWTFGTEKTASNGTKYNVTWGGTHYLIQRNWVNASGGYCALSH